MQKGLEGVFNHPKTREFVLENKISNNILMSVKKSETMDLKKKFAITGICGCLTISLAMAKPAGYPTLDASIKQERHVKTAKLNAEDLNKTYKNITKEPRIMDALELMKGTIGNFSRNAILGNNLTQKEMKIEFRNLGAIKPDYANFDALGWKRGARLYIYVNQKHADAPAAALAALLSHEALHQDEFDSLNEETYAWTMEAAVFTQLLEKDTSLVNNTHPLTYREQTLSKLFIKGDYSDKYIRKTVFSNPGYQNLPLRSPGYEDENL